MQSRVWNNPERFLKRKPRTECNPEVNELDLWFAVLELIHQEITTGQIEMKDLLFTDVCYRLYKGRKNS